MEILLFFTIFLYYLAHPDGQLGKKFKEVTADLLPINLAYDILAFFITNGKKDKGKMVEIVDSALKELDEEGFDIGLLEKIIDKIESRHMNEKPD